MPSRIAQIFEEIVSAVIMGSNALGVASPIIMEIIMALRKRMPDEVKQVWTEAKTRDFVANFRSEQGSSSDTAEPGTLLDEFNKRRTDDDESDDDGLD